MKRERLLGFSSTICLLFPALLTAQGTITTVAGGGQIAVAIGTSVKATSASLKSPTSVGLDGAGNLYILDRLAFFVRKVDMSGTMTNVAGNGNGLMDFSGDGNAATSAALGLPSGLAVDSAGNFYVSDQVNLRVRKISAAGTITTVAGGSGRSEADGIAATGAYLVPGGLAVDNAGNLFIVEIYSNRIRKVDAAGVISTVAGIATNFGTSSFSGDGGLATAAHLNSPTAVAVDSGGNVYVAEIARVRKVDRAGIITTVAGNGFGGGTGIGGPATAAPIAPTGICVDSKGNLYIAESGNQRVTMVNSAGIITVVAGGSIFGFSGDGGLATAAGLAYPTGVTVDGSGSVYIADSGNARVRKISTPQPAIPSIASNGVLSAAAFGAFSSAAPGSFVEIYGANLASVTQGWAGSDFNGSTAPTSLGGTSATIDGQAAFINYVSPSQLDIIVPSAVGVGQKTLIVRTNQGPSSSYMLTINATQPGLLAPSSFTLGGKQYVVGLFPDGTYALPPNAIAGVASRRAKPGDILVMYGVGFGPVTPTILAGQIAGQSNSLVDQLQIFFGGIAATVTYAGLAPGYVGLYQFNVVVPNVPASDLIPITFTLGNVAASQSLYTPVQN